MNMNTLYTLNFPRNLYNYHKYNALIITWLLKINLELKLYFIKFISYFMNNLMAK